MVRFVITPQAAAKVGNYMNSVRGRILDAIAVAMGEEMVALAETLAGKFDGDPLQSRSGNLVAKILSSPKVTETTGAIRGSVSGQDGAKNLLLWLEKGISVPGVANKLFAFVGSDGELKFTHGHRAFKVLAHPVAIPSLQQREAPIMEHIRQAVNDAIAS